MKKIFNLLLIVCLLFCITGCNKNDRRLIGKWEVMEDYSGGYGNIEFTSDGYILLEKSKGFYTYETKNNKELIMHFDGSDIYNSYLYEINNNILELHSHTSNMKYIRVK